MFGVDVKVCMKTRTEETGPVLLRNVVCDVSTENCRCMDDVYARDKTPPLASTSPKCPFILTSASYTL